MNIDRPFFYYYGAKWNVGNKIYPKPDHEVIVEPFAGAAGYASRYWKKKVILNDANPIIYSVWDYLIKSPSSEIRKLPLQFEDVRELNIHQEAKWLIGFWINHGSTAPRNKPSARMRGGLRPNSWWGENIRETLAMQQECIRHWKVTNKDYKDVENTKATWFIDPPYQAPAGKHYPFQVSSYEDLGNWCKNRDGTVIVCEKNGANWLPFNYLASINVNDGSRGKGKSEEAVFVQQRMNDSSTE